MNTSDLAPLCPAWHDGALFGTIVLHHSALFGTTVPCLAPQCPADSLSRPKGTRVQRDQYSVWIVSPAGYSHSRCFEEVALSLHEAFAALGYHAPIVTKPEHVTGTTLVLGCNLLAALKQRLPERFILYNLEQISRDSAWLSAEYVRLLRGHRVWDYSPHNVRALSELGIQAVLCEIGYMPGLSRLPLSSEPDIDVLFVGSMNERRERVLRLLAAAGKRVHVGFDVYGSERDALYARAKLVLNVHYYEAKVLEIVRVSYLLANRVCVVSETGQDLDLEGELSDAMAFAPYEQLAERCLELLDDDTQRRAISERGFERFSTRSQVPRLAAALATPASAAAR